MTAIINSHKLSILKQQKTIILEFWSSDVWSESSELNSSCQQEALQESTLLIFPAFSESPHSVAHGHILNLWNTLLPPLLLSSYPLLLSLTSALSCKYTGDHWGPWGGPGFSYHHRILNVQSPFCLWRWHTQVLGIRLWASLGSLFSLTVSIFVWWAASLQSINRYTVSLS